MAKQRYNNPSGVFANAGWRGPQIQSTQIVSDLNTPYSFEMEDPASFGSHNTRGWIGDRAPEDPIRNLEAIELRDQINQRRAQFPFEQGERQTKLMSDRYALQQQQEMSPLQVAYMHAQIAHEEGGTAQEAATTRLRNVEAEDYGPTHQKHQNAMDELQVLSALFGGVDKLPHGMKDHFLKQFSFNPEDFKEEVPGGVGGQAGTKPNPTARAFEPKTTPARDLMMSPPNPTPPASAQPTPFNIPKRKTPPPKKKRSPIEEQASLYPAHPSPTPY